MKFADWLVAKLTNSLPPVDYIARTQAQYAALGYKDYRWASNQSAPPWTELNKPLSECRVGLIASGGIYRKGQVAFHHQDDLSLRLIASNTNNFDLRTSHFAYDQADARSDPNVVFPLETLRDLRDEGFIGELAANACTFMGGIYSIRNVREVIAPELTRRAIEDQLDLALLVPV